MKVFSVFAAKPTTKHYLLQISRNVGLAHTAVKRYLVGLEKRGIVKRHNEKRGTRNFPHFIANRDNYEFLNLKRTLNLHAILSCGIVQYLTENCTPSALVLFGSFSRGEDIEGSDVDIYVKSPSKELDVSKFEKRIGRKIQLHFKQDFKKYPKELRSNILNGINLKGYLEP